MVLQFNFIFFLRGVVKLLISHFSPFLVFSPLHFFNMQHPKNIVSTMHTYTPDQMRIITLKRNEKGDGLEKRERDTSEPGTKCIINVHIKRRRLNGPPIPYKTFS